MWPFSKKTEQISAADELISSIRRSTEEEPDEWGFKKNGENYWYRRRNSGPWINKNGALSIGFNFERTEGEDSSGDFTGGTRLELTKKQVQEVKACYFDLAATKGIRNILREEK